MKNFFTLSLVAFISLQGLAQSTYSYTGKPRYKILTRRAGTAGTYTIGTINIELFPNIAPKAVRNFDSLVSVSFYDSTAFHRVIPGFMIQGGDPNSRSGPTATWGYGNPNQPTVDAEFSVAKHVRGILSAARVAGNINSATSQFFICVASASQLNGQYTIYGHVTSGMSIADSIVNSPRDANDRPYEKIDMFISANGSNDTVPIAPNLLVPANSTTGVDTTVSLIMKWNPVSDAIIYSLQIARDSLFTDSVAFLDTPNPGYLLMNLAGYTNYYWRVRTNNGGHFSPYSPVWKFSTPGGETITGIATYAPASGKTKVFPNPGQGKFTFSGYEKGNKLQIFSSEGKLIQETLLQEGSTTIDLEGKTKGTYLYKIKSAKDQLSEGKIVLE